MGKVHIYFSDNPSRSLVRSPQAVLFSLLNVHIDAPYEKLEVFKGCPQWLLHGDASDANEGWLHATRMEADLRFAE
jgi:hypothetical protein